MSDAPPDDKPAQVPAPPRPGRDPLIYAAPALLLAALLVLGLMMWLGSTPHAEPEDSPQDEQATSEPAAPAAALNNSAPMRNSPGTHLPDAQTPLYQSLPILLAAAKAGDSRAACRLSMQQMACAGQAPAAMHRAVIENEMRRRRRPDPALTLQLESLEQRATALDAWCPEADPEAISSDRTEALRWLEAAARGGHFRAAILLALRDPATGRPSRAVAGPEGLRFSLATPPVPPSVVATPDEPLESLLQRGRAAGDPLALEASILSAAPSPAASSWDAQIAGAEPDSRDFSTWVATWQLLFPQHPLAEWILAEFAAAQGQRSDAQRMAIEEAALREAAAWPAFAEPLPADFDLEPAVDVCELR